MDQAELKQFIIEVIEEMITPVPIEMAAKWMGGKIVLQPGGDQQPKDVPIDIFFKKVVGIREALRVLEQKLNNYPNIPMEDKVTFQSYITKCYGSLTTFNILFKNDKDRFVGSSGKSGGSEDSKDKMTLSEAKAKLGLNEYQSD